MRTYRILGALIAVALTAADPPKKDANDLEALQGGWRVVTVKAGGEDHSHKLVPPKNRFVFEGAKLTLQDTNRAPVVAFKLGKDGTTRTLDLIFGTDTAPGIYALDGDTLRIIYAFPGEARPKSFVTTANQKAISFVLRREKKDDEKTYAAMLEAEAEAERREAGNQLDEAATAMAKAVELATAYYGPSHGRVGAFMARLGETYRKAGRFVEAEPVLTRALAIAEAEYGPDHLAVEIVSNNLGIVCQTLGDFDRAEKLLARSLAIVEKRDGANARGTALSLINLGALYQAAGEFRRAEPLSLRALAIMEKLRGKDSPEAALVLNNLGVLYRQQARYDDAEKVLNRARTIWETDPGPGTVEVAKVLNNLGVLHQATGSHTRAVLYLTAALEILKKRLKQNHINIATAENNLGMALAEAGELTLAREHLERSIAIYQAAFDRDTPAQARPLHNLGVLYRRTGDLARAESTLLRSIQLLERSGGKDHPETGIARLEYATTLAVTGNTAEALRNADQVIATFRAKLPKDHLHLAKAFEIRSFIHTVSGHPDLARADLVEAVAIHQANLRRVFAFVDEQAMYRLAAEAAAPIDLFPMVVRGKPVEGDAARLVYEWVLRRKAVVLDALSRYRRARPLLDADPGLASKAEHWRALRQQMADLPVRPGLRPEDVEVKLVALGERAATLENELHRALSEKLGGDFFDLDAVTVDRVRDRLRPGEVLVEFKTWAPVVADPDPKKRLGPPRYVAFVLAHDTATVRVVDVGPTNVIDAAIKEFRDEFRPLTAEDSLQRLGKQVYDLLFGKIGAELARADTLLVAADGAINQVPLPALHDGENYLIRKVRCVGLTTGRDLLRPAAARKGAGVVIFDRPDYDLSADDRAKAGATVAKRGPTHPTAPDVPPTRSGWKPLKDLHEAEQIKEALAGSAGFAPVEVFPGAEAREERLKALKSPRVLHLVTHGYYYPAREEARRALSPLSGVDTRLQAADNAFLRSGVVLAGGNRAKDRPTAGGAEIEDGLVTAEEIALLDLTGTELVVLSACETGLGDVDANEGVFGLRRAFLAAGAGAVVSTMFEVPDSPETPKVMKTFYANLAAGKRPAEALRAAQLAALDATGPRTARGRHPFYWGSFLLVGDPR